MEPQENPEPSPAFDLRAAIQELGMSQSGFARRMRQLGDDRPHKNILRSVQRMIAGDLRVSGEIRALIGLMREVARMTGANRDAPPPHRDVGSRPDEGAAVHVQDRAG